jgi:Zn-dependent peptidase ImmA (M78 family)/DNA-binding XRE family transcriptional regulator
MVNLSNNKIHHLLEEQFDGTKLVFARERMGFSGKQLAELIDATPSYITACEKGRKRPSKDLLALLGRELRITSNFFYGKPLGKWAISDCHFRHRQSATMTERNQLRSQLYFISQLVASLGRLVQLPLLNLPTIHKGEHRGVEDIAGQLRRLWKIGASNPVGHLCRLIENAGIFILFRSGNFRDIDAGSHFGPNPLIIVTKKGRGVSRLISDIAHELGELIFRDSADYRASYEKQINHFVGAFLMPANGFSDHFKSKPLTVSHLWELKRTWRVSASAILQRSLRLELIPEGTFVQWKRRFAARGWARLEPNEFPFEGPELLGRVFRVIIQRGIDPGDVGRAAGLTDLGLAELLHTNGLGDLMTTALPSNEDHHGGSELGQDDGMPSFLKIAK